MNYDGVAATTASTLNALKEGWFSEINEQWPGSCMSLKVKKVLTQRKSKFQDICVFESEAVGNVLVLDGVIQTTDMDECSYQEMIANLPLCALKNDPEKVLVIGGGDGGVVREVARHASVKEIHHVEIDEEVANVSKEFLPKLSCGYSQPNLKVFFADGIQFVKDAEENTYDAIIVDSSDPVGPACVLFEKAENMWMHKPIISTLYSMCKEIFGKGMVKYAYTCVPTYPYGQIGFMVCSKVLEDGSVTDVTEPKREIPASPIDKIAEISYYTPDIHRASFKLPKFMDKVLVK